MKGLYFTHKLRCTHITIICGVSTKQTKCAYQTKVSILLLLKNCTYALFKYDMKKFLEQQIQQ